MRWEGFSVVARPPKDASILSESNGIGGLLNSANGKDEWTLEQDSHMDLWMHTI